MSTLSIHVLDTALGKPASGIHIVLEQREQSGWLPIGRGCTDTDGRCRSLCNQIDSGTFRLNFAMEEYFIRQNRQSLYPEISITFRVNGDEHFHIPLLVSDNSYTTYRGS